MPGTTGLISENVASPAIKASRERAIITEERRFPAGSNCHQRPDVTKAMGESQAGVTTQQKAHLTEG